MYEKVIMKSIPKNGMERYIFENVKSIEIKQTFIKKLFNIGNIIIHSNSGNQTTFNSIKKPKKFLEEQIYIM